MISPPLPASKATKYLTFAQVNDELEGVARRLLSETNGRYKFSADSGFSLWAQRTPGVYCLFDKGALIYVGESGDLNGRMRDLKQTRNHTFRRSLGAHLFGNRPGFEPASSKRCFSSELEMELNVYMTCHVTVSSAEIHFGRKEIEEHLIIAHAPMFCTKTRRGYKRCKS